MPTFRDDRNTRLSTESHDGITPIVHGEYGGSYPGGVEIKPGNPIYLETCDRPHEHRNASSSSHKCECDLGYHYEGVAVIKDDSWVVDIVCVKNGEEHQCPTGYQWNGSKCVKIGAPAKGFPGGGGGSHGPGHVMGALGAVPSFVPRLNLHVKPYQHIVSLDETPQSIARKHGVTRLGGYRELLAANLPRKTRPSSLGGAATFFELVEGEALNVPSHWPEDAMKSLAGIPGMLGAPPVLDDTNPVFVAASDSAHAQFDVYFTAQGMHPEDIDAAYACILNAAVAWYVNEVGDSKPEGAVLLNVMDLLVYNAAVWCSTFGDALVSADQAAKFPWGPFGMLLGGAGGPWENVAWAGPGVLFGNVAPPPGYAPTVTAPPYPPYPSGLADWTYIPWDIIAAYGVSLDTISSASPVVYADTSKLGAQQAWQAAIDAAIAGAQPPDPTVTDCAEGYRHVDPTDDTSDCVSICVDPAQWNTVSKKCCPLGSAFDAALGTCDCGTGNVFVDDPNGAGSCQGMGVNPNPPVDDTPAPKKSVVGPVLIFAGLAGLAWFGGKFVMEKMEHNKAL